MNILLNFRRWLEWQEAKAWAKNFRPGWLYLATKSKSDSVRVIYRQKIMRSYRTEVG